MIRAYAITDPKYYGSDADTLSASVSKLLERRQCDYLCFRDKQSADYETVARSFMLTCKAHGFRKMLLHDQISLAHELGAFGVHLSGARFHDIQKAKTLGLYCVASTHSEDMIKEAIDKGVDAVTYSPIFTTPNKGTPKGLDDLKEKTAKMQTHIIALGGIITPLHVKQVEVAGAYAFASIRFFLEDH